MRIDFVKSISPLLLQDPSSVFITGDLGYNAFEDLSKSLGRRFINAGVAEQNMIGFAAGLALSKMRPWVYSIAPFVTYRCLEQIRNDVCLHNLPVRIVGNGGGYTYGIMGSTHHALEDFAVLKSLPNMSLFFPCANDQVKSAVSQIHTVHSPTYLRLSVSPYATALEPLSEDPQSLTRRYSKGQSITVIGIGHAVQVALHALKNHPNAMKDADLFAVSKFPWVPEQNHELLESLTRTRRVIFLEEHYRVGGIAESLLSHLSNHLYLQSVEFLTAAYSLNQKYGSHAFHLKQCGLTPEALISQISRPTQLRIAA